jgi:hypothetical protein
MRGTLQEFSLADVIRFISQARKTGELNVSGPHGNGRILFRDGAICGADSTLAREPLGRKLVRAGAVSESQLWSALGRQDRSQIKLGETLVAAGLVAREQVREALREQVEEGIVAVLRIEPTEFSWSAQESEGDVVVLADDVLDTLTANRDEIETISRRFPSKNATVAMVAAPPSGEAAMQITPEDWRILAFMGSRRTLADLMQYTGAGEVQTLRALDRLIAAGLLEVVDPTADPRARSKRQAAMSASLPPPPPRGVSDQNVIRLPETGSKGAPVDTFRVAFVGSQPTGLSSRAAALFAGHTRGLAFRVAVQSLFVEGEDEVVEGSQRLKDGSLTDMDLVLGFDWSQVESAVVAGGAPPEVTFTILELWALIDFGGAASTPEGARGAVSRAHARRIGHAELMSNLEMHESSEPGPDALRVREICASLANALFGGRNSGTL